MLFLSSGINKFEGGLLMLYKIRLIPVSLTDWEYKQLLHYSKYSGSRHVLFTHLLLTGLRTSSYIPLLPAPPSVNFLKGA